MASRWYDTDPLRDVTSLRTAMDRLMEQAIVRPGAMLAPGQQTFAPPLNVSEVGNQYIAQVMLPGVRAEDVEVTVRQNTVAFKGRWSEPPSGEDGKRTTWLLREFPGGEFARTITLPKSIASERVEARFEDGVLTIVLPLAAHEQPRQINIKSSRGGKAAVSAGRTMPPEPVDADAH
ncbi:MAG TPA: Hsp20/alpha crystallin family protein [Ktedonobacterales bacterium]|jgi:HSP20 family protein